MKNIKEFCSVCYTAFFSEKCVPPLIMATSNIRWYRCRSWGSSGYIGVVLIAYSSHAAAIKDGAAAVGRKYAVQGC